MCPIAEKITFVTDNLNTHLTALLYKAFSPEEAHRIANRFEWHYTPKHASRLNMAKIEIGIMCRQALAKPLWDIDSFSKHVKSWTTRRNIKGAKASWGFTTKDANIQL